MKKLLTALFVIAVFLLCTVIQVQAGAWTEERHGDWTSFTRKLSNGDVIAILITKNINGDVLRFSIGFFADEEKYEYGIQLNVYLPDAARDTFVYQNHLHVIIGGLYDKPNSWFSPIEKRIIDGRLICGHYAISQSTFKDFHDILLQQLRKTGILKVNMLSSRETILTPIMRYEFSLNGFFEALVRCMALRGA